MDPSTQAVFFGIALVLFVFAFIVSIVRANPANRLLELDWVALGLASPS